VDNENGLRLKAGYIEYKEGAFIRARALELLSAKETFRAQSLDYDIPKQEARFGALVFANADFKGLSAERALALFAEDIVVLKGKVRADSPRLEAGKATLRGQGPSARLYLRFVGGKVQASTKLPPQAARLEVYSSRQIW
jgi:hypothetical protein